MENPFGSSGPAAEHGDLPPSLSTSQIMATGIPGSCRPCSSSAAQCHTACSQVLLALYFPGVSWGSLLYDGAKPSALSPAASQNSPSLSYTHSSLSCLRPGCWEWQEGLSVCAPTPHRYPNASTHPPKASVYTPSLHIHHKHPT